MNTYSIVIAGINGATRIKAEKIHLGGSDSKAVYFTVGVNTVAVIPVDKLLAVVDVSALESGSAE